MQKILSAFNSSLSFGNSKVSVFEMLMTVSFTILTIIAAQITIPAYPVPFTLQTVSVVLSGAFLGAKRGGISQMLYLGLGIIGLPVFAQMPGNFQGVARLFGPTGGYLLAFPIAALLTGYIVERFSSKFSVLLSMVLGNIAVIVIGALFLDLFFTHNLTESLKVGVVIFSFWSIIKVAISYGIFTILRRKAN